MISDVSEVLAEMENSNKREKGKSEFLRATALPSERISLHSKSHK